MDAGETMRLLGMGIATPLGMKLVEYFLKRRDQAGDHSHATGAARLNPDLIGRLLERIKLLEENAEKMAGDAKRSEEACAKRLKQLEGDLGDFRRARAEEKAADARMWKSAQAQIAELESRQSVPPPPPPKKR